MPQGLCRGALTPRAPVAPAGCLGLCGHWPLIPGAQGTRGTPPEAVPTLSPTRSRQSPGGESRGGRLGASWRPKEVRSPWVQDSRSPTPWSPALPGSDARWPLNGRNAGPTPPTRGQSRKPWGQALQSSPVGRLTLHFLGGFCPQGSRGLGAADPLLQEDCGTRGWVGLPLPDRPAHRRAEPVMRTSCTSPVLGWGASHVASPGRTCGRLSCHSEGTEPLRLSRSRSQ